MTYFIRKINRAKWGDKVDAPVSADAITVCCKTSSNKLSVWQANDEAELENAKIALLGTLQERTKVDFIIFNQDQFAWSISDEIGDTAAVNFQSMHRNISILTYEDLGRFAGLVRSCIFETGGLQNIPVREMEAMLKKAVADNLIDKANLKGKLKNLAT